MQYDHMNKMDRGALPSDGVYSDTLNKIRELPEEYEKLPNAHHKAHTQKDERSMQPSMDGNPRPDNREGDLTDHNFDGDELNEAGDKST